MLREQIIEIVNKYYPNCIGAILTGSQVKKSSFDLKSDFDIVIISEHFCVCSSFLITVDNTKFDFTQVPFYDIDNILFNEKFDPRGVLLTMLTTGIIIKNSTGNFMNLLKLKATNFHQSENFNWIKRIAESRTQLLNIKKELTKPLNFHHRFIIINEFIYLIMMAEFNRNSNWSEVSKRKIRYLNEYNSDFIKDIVLLTKEPLTHLKNNDMVPLTSYLDFYLASYIKKTINLNPDRCVLDISYADFNTNDFLTEVLPKVKVNKFLSQKYQCFFLSSKINYRIYKNQICLVFKCLDNKSVHLIVSELNNLLTFLAKTNVKISLFPSHIYGSENPNRQFIYDFEEVAKEIGVVFEKQVNSNEMSQQKSFLMTLSILASLIKYIDIGIADVLLCNKLNANRYLLSVQDQNTIKHPSDILGMKERKQLRIDLLFSGENSAIDDLVSKGLTHNTLNENTSEYKNILRSLKAFCKRQSKKKDYLHEANTLTVELLQNKTENDHKALVYKLTTELIIQYMNLDSEHSGLVLLLLNNSLMFQKR